MRKKKNITSLNISGNFTTCAICSIDDKGNIVMQATASVPSRGIEGGAISDLSEVASVVSRVIEKSESIAHAKAFSLTAGFDGSGIRSYDTRGNITVAEKENEISRRDVERVTEAAKTIALPFDREIIYSIIRDFILDGQEGVKDPSGMFGTRLEVDMQIVTGLITHLHNLRRAINTAGFEIQDIVLSGIAAARTILEELEKDLGVIFIYVSYSSTHIVVYNAGHIKSIEVLPMGSADLIELICDKFKMPREYAEDMLNRDAALDRSSITEEDKIISKVGSAHRSISKIALYETIEPKAKELIQKITDALKRMAFAKDAAAGCVVAGELSDLGGFLEMLELSLNMPVKMGLVKDVFNVSGEMMRITDPGQIACLGLVKYWAQEGARKKVRKNILGNTPAGKLFDKAREIFSDYF